MPKEAPPEYEFLADPPSISAFDLGKTCGKGNTVFSTILKSPYGFNIELILFIYRRTWVVNFFVPWSWSKKVRCRYRILAKYGPVIVP